MIERPLVGILGGMGPAATVDFYSKLIAATPASTDEEHLKVMIWADPSVPDRTKAIVRGGEDPTPKLVNGAQRLKDAGAAFYVVTCNGAHAFLPRVRQQVDLEYLSIVEVTAEHLAALPYVSSAGLLATDATLTAGLYQESLAASNLTPVLPDAAGQHAVMEAIYAVKAGSLTAEQERALVEVAESLVGQGADVIVAACTEIPLALSAEDSPRPLIDPSILLANQVVQKASAWNK
ncbi:cysteate racemase [Nesterenkonia ebinurensis]|uniref:aspartate/glutamate racemase family protein n=1 Tax=Nesterenkonia ebinurensis TaxID=2608252 RepID=UPI00123DC8D6|nr:amino acid racemase [Nesterenkonia ebinurensis]